MKRENNISEKITVLSMTREVTISNEYMTIVISVHQTYFTFFYSIQHQQ